MLDRNVAQVRLLLSMLPDIANETVFAFIPKSSSATGWKLRIAAAEPV